MNNTFGDAIRLDLGWPVAVHEAHGTKIVRNGGIEATGFLFGFAEGDEAVEGIGGGHVGGSGRPGFGGLHEGETTDWWARAGGDPAAAGRSDAQVRARAVTLGEGGGIGGLVAVALGYESGEAAKQRGALGDNLIVAALVAVALGYEGGDAVEQDCALGGHLVVAAFVSVAFGFERARRGRAGWCVR